MKGCDPVAPPSRAAHHDDPGHTMPDGLPPAADDSFLAALALAATAVGRLDQALAGHKLLPAFLYRPGLADARRDP